MDTLPATLKPFSPSSLERDIVSASHLSREDNDAFLDKLRRATLSWLTAGVLRDAKAQAKSRPASPTDSERSAYQQAQLHAIHAYQLLWPDKQLDQLSQAVRIIDVPASAKPISAK